MALWRDGRGGEGRRSARNSKRVVDIMAIRKTGETWAEREKNVDKIVLVEYMSNPYVCMYGHHIHRSGVWINRVRLPILLVVS